MGRNFVGKPVYAGGRVLTPRPLLVVDARTLHPVDGHEHYFAPFPRPCPSRYKERNSTTSSPIALGIVRFEGYEALRLLHAELLGVGGGPPALLVNQSSLMTLPT